LTIDQTIQIGFEHHQAGRLAQAEEIYRRILARQPDHAEALRLLGTLAAQSGRWDAAVELLRKAIGVKPDNAQAHNNLGNALARLGRIDEAVAAYRQSIRVKPDYADAHYNLGRVLQGAEKTEEAIASYRQAIQLKPDFAEAHNNLGNAMRDRGQVEEAMAAYRRAIQLKPDHAEAHTSLGDALQQTGHVEEAIIAYEQAIGLKPGLAKTHSNLGNAFREMGRLEGAIAAYRHAIQLQPDLAITHNNLGAVLQDMGQLDDAVAAYREAIRLNPEYAEAHNNLGNAFKDMGRIDEAIATYRQALVLKPDYPAAHGNLLLALHYHAAFDPQALLIESEQWNRRHARPGAPGFIQAHANDRNPDRKLRIGYVSPDFRDHAVSRFAMPLLAAHDHKAFEVFAYAQVPVPDRVTAKLQSCCDAWRSIVGLSDERVAEMIRDDRIDILIDLAGHTSDNRLLVFAHKPAPVQVTWLGYPGTTGLCTMDYRLTDALADPPGETDRFCSEQLIRLPKTDWCFAPPDDSPRVSELPALANGRVTFGSFNNFAKVTKPTLKLWSQILRATPGSKLMLKANSLRSESVQEGVRRVMADAGIEPQRLELLGFVPSAAHLAQYGHVDIALDTYPYHGTTTTCESLWMGVPVVSLAGDSHVSRVGVSLLTSVGLRLDGALRGPELIAQTPEQYVQVAVDLANDLPRLAELRRTLRPRMQASPLMDAPAFARDVEAAYRAMWRDWCGQT